ncbi:MAG TPA: hypothetical protein VFY29_08015 [Terriglobia bacterium]|nr:hypothetical protein [Terriglobia bacterium]
MADLPAALNSKINRLPLAYLREKSAHSDLASQLLDAVKPLGDVQTYCPDWQAYRYVAVSTNNIIFGFAIGMDTIAFRLDTRMAERAIATGGSPVPECGGEWVAVMRHRSDSDWPAVDLTFWARKAYVYARE